MRTEADDPLTLRRDALRRIVYGTPDPSAAVIAELVGRRGRIRRARGCRRRRSPGSRIEGAAAGARSAARIPIRSGAYRRRSADAGSRDGCSGLAGGRDDGRGSRARPRAGRPVAAAWTRGLRTPGDGRGAGARGRGRGRRRLQPASSSALRRSGRVFGYEFWVLSRRRSRVPALPARILVRVGRRVRHRRGVRRVGAHARHPRRRALRPRPIVCGVTPDDAVVVSWGPDSLELEWSIIRARSRCAG